VDPSVRACEVPPSATPALVKADCYRFKVRPDVDRRFALYYLNSSPCARFTSAHHHGMTLLRIGLGNFRRLPVPLPPTDEQRAIVSRIDRIVSLCDRLEEQLGLAQIESGRLLEAVLNRALDVGSWDGPDYLASDSVASN
jgi:type I restriction enzyme S subunit